MNEQEISDKAYDGYLDKLKEEAKAAGSTTPTYAMDSDAASAAKEALIEARKKVADEARQLLASADPDEIAQGEKLLDELMKERDELIIGRSRERRAKAGSERWDKMLLGQLSLPGLEDVWIKDGEGSLVHALSVDTPIIDRQDNIEQANAKAVAAMYKKKHAARLRLLKMLGGKGTLAMALEEGRCDEWGKPRKS